ncbi:MAG: sensor histidine kinase [Pirellulales bacterium]
MRWPIQIQILLPMMAIVLVATVAAALGSAYLGGVRAHREQEENLKRVAKTLADGSFPLTQRVLAQMAGLSGAEFVLVTGEGLLQDSTIRTDADEFAVLTQLRVVPAMESRPVKPSAVVGGREFFVDCVPVHARSPGGTSGTLYVLFPKDRWWARVQQATYPALMTGILAAGVALVTTTLLTRRIVRPIHTLVEQTAKIAGGDFTPVLVARRNDELRDLALSIGHMTARLARYESEVRQHERLRTLGQVGAAMAHQLRNAATGGSMAIDFHRRDCPIGATDESLQVASRQLRLMESYLQRFLAIGKGEAPLQEAVSMNATVEDVLTLLTPMSVHAGVEVRLAKPETALCVHGDPEGIRQLTTNLITNAIEAARVKKGGPGFVDVVLGLAGDGRGLFEVRDDGPGLDAAIESRLFEAFASTKPDGVGLGLWVARRIAETHGGTLQWERREGLTCFSFEFPLYGEEDHGAPPDC